MSLSIEVFEGMTQHEAEQVEKWLEDIISSSSLEARAELLSAPPPPLVHHRRVATPEKQSE